MRQKSVAAESASERIVKTIRRATRKHYSAEEKIRIVLDGLRGESSIAELCRRESIAESLYYTWSKEFLEAGKRRLAGDTARTAPELDPGQFSMEIPGQFLGGNRQWSGLATRREQRYANRRQKRSCTRG
jgi:transposase-like protein